MQALPSGAPSPDALSRNPRPFRRGSEIELPERDGERSGGEYEGTNVIVKFVDLPGSRLWRGWLYSGGGQATKGGSGFDDQTRSRGREEIHRVKSPVKRFTGSSPV